MCDNFDIFKKKVADLVNRIVLDRIDIIDNLSSWELGEKGFLYFRDRKYCIFSSSIIDIEMLLRIHGGIESLMSYTRVYEFLDIHYLKKYQCARQERIDCLFNEAVNEVWKECLDAMRRAVGFHNYYRNYRRNYRNGIDWERDYPMIEQYYRQ